MRTLTVYWIGVVIVLAVLNGIRALPAASRARRFMWNMGIATAVLGGLAIIALKSVSQNANSPSTLDAQQINSTSIVVPDDILRVQSRLIDLGHRMAFGETSHAKRYAHSKPLTAFRQTISGTPKLVRNSFQRRRLDRPGRQEAASGHGRK